MQHYTFSSNSKEINEINSKTTSNVNITLNHNILNPNFHKKNPDLNNENKTKNKFMGNFSLKAKSNLLDVPNTNELKETYSLSNSNRFPMVNKISKSSDKDQRMYDKNLMSQKNKSVSDISNIFKERVILNSDPNVVGYMYIPKHLLAHSGWNIFLRRSSKVSEQDSLKN